MATTRQIALWAGNALGSSTSKETLVTAVAIALAESGGDETITHTNTNGTTDTGLWQINSVHRRTHPEWTPAWLKVGENNAKAMAVVSGGGTNWTPWVVYNSGRYQSKIAEATAAIDSGDGQSLFDALGNILLPGGGAATDALGAAVPDPLEGLAEAVANVSGIVVDAAVWVGNPDNWVRILQVVGGIALGLLAANIVVRPYVEKAAGPAVKAATKGIL